MSNKCRLDAKIGTKHNKPLRLIIIWKLEMHSLTQHGGSSGISKKKGSLEKGISMKKRPELYVKVQ